jgi:hypothetical protein
MLNIELLSNVMDGLRCKLSPLISKNFLRNPKMDKYLVI